ncbi:serine/threonine-protein kinase RsbW [Methylomagnum ishizawai]|uniref:Serine/threonine-protein kinase RsbW n=1 Tax=Methylomagnum ishizawai TaxID=1760988 RepID=A0A1Y6CT81_9GAMM|nr:ATP-binding protein [Methylomagnum ishizawai]SMF93507.1 serine/threonine-protein kinase RsbW [Methylomagnum ishizawai]
MCEEGCCIHLDIVVPNQTRYLGLIGNIAEELARVLDGYSGDRDALAYHLNLVLTEAMVNAIEHCPENQPRKTVRVCIYIADKELNIHVHDQGQGFDLDAVPAPDFDDPCERGRGIFLIRTLMDTVAYRKTESGNVLEMYKKLE